jgi:hypothetical protein
VAGNQGFSFARLDRRAVYAAVAISLIVPLILQWRLPPAQMKAARKFFDAVESLQPDGGIVLIALDWGPGTKAENQPQTEVLVEHLMRRRVPFALITNVVDAETFMKTIPEDVAKRLKKESPREKWEYGKDWVDLGYQPGWGIMIQKIAAATDLQQSLGTDARGTPLSEIPCMRTVKSIKDIKMLAEFTGLTGAFSAWVQFFQTNEYRPPMAHGCTSITIPDAYNYLDSGQIVGLHEGIAGAAAYSDMLSKQNSKRGPDSAIVTNTALAVAHVVVIVLIVMGNVGMLLARRRPVAAAEEGA